ncbi:AAA family ATPase [Azotobacter chroococcum]|uniref:AAA family ATPase n=1 Tax=Azotobacter chroococcum TaxID=353 RepID=UPI00103AF2B7|nr:ATP-binding protein [Azotobacter chroococcum]TBW39914.1 AAA family ATPase [Azotobacter chroococcum]
MSIRRRQSVIVTANYSDTCALALKWSFRLMVELQGHRHLLTRETIEDYEVARELGLEKWVEAETYNRLRAVQQLRRNARQFESGNPEADYPEPLGSNLQALAQLIGLDGTEIQLLGFCAMLHCDTLLNRAASVLGSISNRRLPHVLAVLLERPPEDIQQALARDGQLVASGLLSLNYEGRRQELEDILDFNSRDLLNQLCFHQGEPEALFQHSFRASAPAMLLAEDYPHLRLQIDMAVRYLRKSLEQRRQGVNILVYGPPGTGKTELCRMLARELTQELYEIACSDSDGDPISGHQRLCALRSAMHVFRDGHVLLMLDEIEDIFMESGGKGRRVYKSWVNRMLEENSQPCFWLSNDIGLLDPAYIRRFDLVIEAPNPDRESRARIIRNLGGSRLGEQMVDRLAGHEGMTPAVFERAYRVARVIHPRAGSRQNQALKCLLDATLKAQGHDALSQARRSNLPGLYSPQLVNTDIPLGDLLFGLRRCPQARLCFYGLPGTGKTAFAHWLAESLGKPLHVKRASELLGSLVGETEQNLAEAFRLADRDGAVLVLDEVDSFLQDRRKAMHSWEVTAVNEMLTQMESFDGLFIASTNLMADLDEAALRRFDLKVNFKALRTEQARTLLHAHLRELGLKDPKQTAERRIASLHNLTPGDFAAISRRARFKPFASALEFAEALVGEVGLKKGGQRPIGFLY